MPAELVGLDRRIGRGTGLDSRCTVSLCLTKTDQTDRLSILYSQPLYCARWPNPRSTPAGCTPRLSGDFQIAQYKRVAEFLLQFLFLFHRRKWFPGILKIYEVFLSFPMVLVPWH